MTQATSKNRPRCRATINSPKVNGPEVWSVPDTTTTLLFPINLLAHEI